MGEWVHGAWATPCEARAWACMGKSFRRTLAAASSTPAACMVSTISDSTCVCACV
jgi:hypothetical protein